MNGQTNPMEDNNVIPYGQTILDDIEVDRIEIEFLEFTPHLKSPVLELDVSYKPMRIPFASLPVELQNKIKLIIQRRVTLKLANEKRWASYKPKVE